MSTVNSPTRELDKAALAVLADSSVQTILALQDQSGAYPACHNFPAYRGYAWLRDGSFTADAVSAYGAADSATSFFDWCGRVLLDRAPMIEGIVTAQRAGRPVADKDMLPTRFTLDGSDGVDEWWDFQMDGYGTWLWAVVEHGERHGLGLDRWQRAIELTVDYLLSSWHRPCFDWWEERDGQVHVSTLTCIAAGLAGADRSGVLDPARAQAACRALSQIDDLVRARGIVGGHLVKSLGTSTVDASVLSAISPLRIFPSSDPVAAGTIAEIDAQLNVDGGVHRYRADTFYGGGQWPLLSCMLGLCLASIGDVDRGLQQLRWAAGSVTADHEMPEQVDGHLLNPSMRQEWLDRWGPVATPLLWSHAMYIRLAVQLGVVQGSPR